MKRKRTISYKYNPVTREIQKKIELWRKRMANTRQTAINSTDKKRQRELFERWNVMDLKKKHWIRHLKEFHNIDYVERGSNWN